MTTSKAGALTLAFCVSALAFDVENALKEQLSDCKLQFKSSMLSNEERMIPWFKGECAGSEVKVLVKQELVRTHPMMLAKKISKKESSWHILRFEEPSKYRPKYNWLVEQAKNFAKGQSIDALSGATLTKQATERILKEFSYIESLDILK